MAARFKLQGHEPRQSLWTLAFGPTIWAAHFLACYVAAAVICARSTTWSLDLAAYRWFVVVLTGSALLIIAYSAWHAVRIWELGSDHPPHDDDTDENRSQFLALATLFLSGLSFVATLFTALPTAIVLDCR